MTEILTESFCERCGTRYTFEAAHTRTRLKGVRVLSRGLKNFVLSDDTSMDEAMAAARSETDREVTAHQLDAFHKTFNFCMSCRQYTCPNCWNEAEARCLSCAPHLGHEIMPAPFPDLPATGLMVADPLQVNGTTAGQETDGVHGFALAAAEAAAGGESEDEVDVAARLASLTAAPSAVEPPVAPAAWAPPSDEAAMVAPVEAAPSSVVEEPAAETSAEADGAGPARGADLGDLAAAAIVVDAVNPEAPVAPTSTGRTDGRRPGFGPGQNLDAELDDYERERTAALALAAADAEVSAEPEVVADLAVEAEVVAEPEMIAEPEIVAKPEIAVEAEVVAEPETSAEAEVAAEPETIAAAEVAAAADVETAPATAPVVDDVIKQPTWRMVAPDSTPDAVLVAPIDPASIPAAATADPKAEPQWPTRPEWPGSRPAVGLPFLGRPPAPQGGLESLWAESTRDIVAGPATGRATTGVQPCVSCGLSLSATARFCRRCGASQPR
jgi:hypothetical protein